MYSGLFTQHRTQHCGVLKRQGLDRIFYFERKVTLRLKDQIERHRDHHLKPLTCPQSHHRSLAHSPRYEIILFSSFLEHTHTVSEVLCHYTQITSSSVSLPIFAHNDNISIAWWTHSLIFGCVLETLDSGKDVSLPLPLNVQNCSCGAGL